MAKRFTDSEKWKDEWFTDLDPVYKIFFLYLLDCCDHAGIWKVNFKLASFQIGVKIDKQKALEAFAGRVIDVKGEYWFIPKFIKFQYPDGLSEDCKAHKGVLKVLRSHGLQSNCMDRVSIEYGNSSLTVQDKDKDKDKDSIKKGGVGENKLTPDHVIDLWNNYMGADFGHCSSLGGGKHLESCLESIKFLPKPDDWTELFDLVKQSGFLTGESDLGWKVSLPWLVNFDNVVKVRAGSFPQGNSMKHLFAGLPKGD